MGKAKPKTFLGSAVRNNPTNHNVVCGEEDLENASEDDWQRISHQLQSGSSEERECGCSSLSIIGTRKQNADIIIRKKMIRIVAPLMMDKNLSVQSSAVGALRNISLADPEICEQMVIQDVMTPLCKRLLSYDHSDWKPVSKTKSTEGKIDSKTEIFIDAVNLLWNLSEASDTALQMVHKNNLIELLMKHACLQPFGHRVVTSVLQCLFTISEDCKEPILSNLKGYGSVMTALKSIDGETPQDLHIKLLAYGIELNLVEANGEQIESLWSEILQIISLVLEQDQRKLVHEFSSSMPLNDAVNEGASNYNSESESMMEKEDKDASTKHETLRDTLNHVILAQQSALEILTNLCCDDSNYEDCSETDDDEDDMNGDNKVEIHENDDASMETESINDGMPSVILEAIKAHKLLEKILNKALFLPAENVQEILKSPEGRKNDGKMVMQMVTTLQTKACLCLNNLIEALTVEDLGGDQALFEVWKKLGQFSLTSNDQLEHVLEASTSAMRATTQKMAKSQQMNELTSEDLQKLAEFGAKSNNSNIRVNLVHLLGTIGQSCTKNEQIQIFVATFLTEAATRDVELRVVSEALDKIIDMFTEDETDKLCTQVGLIGKLKKLQPGFRTKLSLYKQQRKSEGGNYAETIAMANMVKNNLNRFIKYKEKRCGN